jgi:hypothetical protein
MIDYYDVPCKIRKGGSKLARVLPHAIEEEDVPTIYELSYEPRTTSLEIRVSKKAVSYLVDKLNSGCKQIWDLQAEHGLPDFVPPTKNGDCGFGAVITKLTNDPSQGFESWLASPPVYLPGDDNSLVSDYWNNLLSMSATLKVLFDALALFPGDSGLPTRQLIAIELTTLQGRNGGQVKAHLAKRLVPWLCERCPVQDDCTLSEPMRAVYGSMFPHRTADPAFPNEFSARIDDFGRLYLQVSGEECRLLPNDDDVPTPGRGYALRSQNSSLAEQLSFLSGLSALHTQARNVGL